MSTTVEAAGFLLLTRSSPQKLLLMKHHDRWDLPKGHAEPGEEILQAALRETEEETGIAASLIEVVPEFSFIVEYDVKGQKRGNYHKRVTYFLGLVREPYSVHLTEHIGYEWFDWPAKVPIQAQTIDPLLQKLAEFLALR
ncbi:MAG: NUDIX domain-containing protein [Pirellulales bacterium]